MYCKNNRRLAFRMRIGYKQESLKGRKKKTERVKGNCTININTSRFQISRLQQKHEESKIHSTHILATSITPSLHVISDSFNFSISLSTVHSTMNISVIYKMNAERKR